MIATKTLCGRCAMGCGVRAMADPQDGKDRRVFLEGDRIHPANMGWLCPAGEALVFEAGLEGRLLHARLGARRIPRDRAIAQAAKRLTDIVARHGAGSVALHVAGDLTTEDYFVANKLMKGFIGSANIDVPWAEAGAQAHRVAFGEDVMPTSVEDIEQAELILLIGAQALQRHPLLNERVRLAREEQGALLVVIDPDPASADGDADLYLTPAPGTVDRLLGGLLLHCHDANLIDLPFLSEKVALPHGYWDDLRPGHDLWSVTRATGWPAARIRELKDMIAGAGRMVTIFDPDGEEGADRTAAAILALHLATGRIGRPGAGPFALPGAPNAMGAREAGCCATTLAAHHAFGADGHGSVARFWAAPKLVKAPGLAGAALLDAIRDGRIKALIMLGAMPPVWFDALPASRPFTLFVGDRLDPSMADRIDIALPMAAMLERDGTLTSADRLIGRQRPVFPLPGEARPGWWIVTQIARAMGWHEAFHYERPAEIYREHARLSAYHDDGRRVFTLRRHAPVSNPAYQELTPWRWGELPFDEGRFPTDDGKARLVRFWD